MANTVTDYQNLITSEYQNQINFQTTVALSVGFYCQLQSLFDQMAGPLFDVDTPPVGNQLDIIGQWVGVSRDVENPYSNIFFAWDGTAAQGWDSGIWRSSNNPSAIVVLPDDVYINLIRAKIALNNWDGTTNNAYQVLAKAFPNLLFLYQDYQNMTFAVAIIGTIPDSLTLALITSGLVTPRPEGVLITEYFIQTQNQPMFAWDSNSTNLKGWNTGYWATEVFP